MIRLGADFGLSGGGGLGSAAGLNLHLPLGWCGPAIDWHSQDIHYWDPADLHNTVYGAGVICNFSKFGGDRWFWKMVRLEGEVLLKRGSSDYLVYGERSGEKIPLSGGSVDTKGYSIGASFYFPLWLGFWAYSNLGYEYMPYKYPVKGPINGFSTPHLQESNIYARVGISYSL